MSYSLYQLKVAYEAGKKDLAFGTLLNFLDLIDIDEHPQNLREILAHYTGGKIRSRSAYKAISASALLQNQRLAIRNRAGMGEKIVDRLKKAGDKGLHIKELSKDVGELETKVASWIYSGSGKRLMASKKLIKTSPGTFRFKSN